MPVPATPPKTSTRRPRTSASRSPPWWPPPAPAATRPATGRPWPGSCSPTCCPTWSALPRSTGSPASTAGPWPTTPPRPCSPWSPTRPSPAGSSRPPPRTSGPAPSPTSCPRNRLPRAEAPTQQAGSRTGLRGVVQAARELDDRQGQERGAHHDQQLRMLGEAEGKEHDVGDGAENGAEDRVTVLDHEQHDGAPFRDDGPDRTVHGLRVAGICVSRKKCAIRKYLGRRGEPLCRR